MVEEQSYRILPTALNVFVVLFALLTAMHFLIVPESYRTPMIILAAIALATGSLMRVFVGHRLMRENANVALIVLAGLVALNAAAHLYLSGDIKQTTNLLFLVVLWGYVFHDSRSYVVVLVATLAGWAGIAGEIGWNDITRHYAFAMVLATALSIFLHVFRRMTVKQLVDLRKTTLQLEETREQARSDESLIRTLMRNVPAGVIVYGTDRRIQFVNPFALDILRADAETLVGAEMGDLSWQLYDERGAQVPVEDLPAHRVFQTGEPVTDELFSMRHPDGKRSYVIITAFPIFGEEGDRMVVSTFADASERMEAERRLRENENLSRAILNSIADGVIAVDKQDRITHFNPAAQRVTGRHRDEAVGQPLSDIFHFREDHMTSTIAFSQGFVERKGGDEVFVELLTAELFDRNGEHLGNVLTFRDMSEQLRIEQQRSTLDKMASVGVLAGGIAHDFNNLLVGLYGNVSLAQASAGEPEKQSGFLDRAMDSLDKATKLTKQLLTFATGSDPVRRVTGVETLVRETTKFALSGSSTSAEFDIDKDLWDIEA
ncbi:MAG: PAS domain S-box protein, partial [Pseudomonadales bacterium]|nr:PAS domain S-box protein [Pseudomonadales bacterium]